MAVAEEINVENFEALKNALVGVINSEKHTDIEKMRLLIESKLEDLEWDYDVLLPISQSEEFKEKDFSKLFYNVPYKLLDVIAENYDLYVPLTTNKYCRPIIAIITNIIESENCSLNMIVSMVDYLNKLDLPNPAEESILNLRFHIINEVFITGTKRLKDENFECSELLKTIVVSQLKFFMRISKTLQSPIFFLKRIYVFARDFMPSEHSLVDEGEMKTIGKLLLMFLFKAVDIMITCKNSSQLISEKEKIVFKELGNRIYQLALSYDVDFDDELGNINKTVEEFKSHALENCKDKTDDEIQEYLYHLAILQDTQKDVKTLILDYKTVLYLYMTNHATENSDSTNIPIETLLVTYFKINAFHTANDYNDPFILNGLLETTIKSSKAVSIDLPQKVVTQVLQQLSFQGENSLSTIIKILSLMDYSYQMWYILDTLKECPLDEVRAQFWKFVLPEFIKANDKTTWISLCNIADVEVLDYTDGEGEGSDEKISKKHVINGMFEFLEKYKSLTDFVGGLKELIELYENLESDSSDEETQ